MHGYQGNLLDPAAPSESIQGDHFHNFDVAAVGLGFHHFPDPELAAVRLVDRLRPGGVLFLVEFVSHAPDAWTNPTVMHHGFTEERMRDIFEKAGAGKGFAVEEMGKGIVFNSGGHGKALARRVMIARGEKA
jgi:SAM-dependent methyltransferase